MQRFMSAICVSVLLMAGSATAALAKGTAYDCRVKTNRSHLGWLPKVIWFGHLDNAAAATVSDPIILKYNDRQPIQAKVTLNNNKRITFSWEVEGRSRTGQNARIKYRATYVKSNGVLSIGAHPLNYANKFTGIGNCQLKPL